MDEIKRNRMNELQPKMDIYKQVQASVSVIEDAKQFISIDDFSDEISMLNEEIQAHIEYLKKYQEDALSQKIEQNEYDHVRQPNGVVRAGFGNSEGSLIAEHIIGMIQDYARELQINLKLNILNKLQNQFKRPQIGKGCKSGILQISGDHIYQQLKCESGVHNAIRVPETETKGRLHSSTASMILLLKVTDNFHLSDKDLIYEFMRASRPGGQNVNKTESACELLIVRLEFKLQICKTEVQEKQERMARIRKSQFAGSVRSDKNQNLQFSLGQIADHRTNLQCMVWKNAIWRTNKRIHFKIL